MAYTSFALLPTLPAIYNLMPSQKHKRRTATGIMAGHFDPLPILSNQVSKPLQDPIRAPSPSSVVKNLDLIAHRAPQPQQERPPDETRSNFQRIAIHASKKNRTFSSTSIIDGTVQKHKVRRVKSVHLDDKENARSTRDPPRSTSPRLTSSSPPSPLPSVVIFKEKHKASEFWRARATNTSASPVPSSSLKRKFSVTSHDGGDLSSSQTAGPSTTATTTTTTTTTTATTTTTTTIKKKSRLSTSLGPEAPSSSRLFASSDSLSSQSPSLDFDSQNLVSVKPKKKLKRYASHVILSNNKAHHLSSDGVPIKKSMSHSDIPRAASSAESPQEPPEPKLNRLDASQLYEVIKKTGIRCKLCEKISINVAFMETHLRTAHSDKIDMDAFPQPPPRRPRGPRKNVAVKKGWKGWVEDDLEPQKLILLDKPEVLPERTTRSGRKI